MMLFDCEEQMCKVLMPVFQPLRCCFSFKSLTVALPVLHDALFECEERVCKAFMPIFQLLHLQYLLPFKSLTMALPVLQDDVCECCAASTLPLKVFKFHHGFTCVAGWHVWMSSSHCAAFAFPGLHSWLYLCAGVCVAGWRVWVRGAGVPGADAHLPAALLQPYPGAAAESSVPRGTRVWIVDQRWAALATSHIPYFLLLFQKDKFSKLTVEKRYTCTVKCFHVTPFLVSFLRQLAVTFLTLLLYDWQVMGKPWCRTFWKQQIPAKVSLLDSWWWSSSSPSLPGGPTAARCG